jgi:chaperonin GroES
MNLKPLGDNVVVKQAEAEEQTKSGLFIPDTAKEKPQKGTVVAVGEGKFEDGARVPVDVKEGDVVIYSKYGGTDVKVDDVEYKILRASDIYAIVSE